MASQPNRRKILGAEVVAVTSSFILGCAKNSNNNSKSTAPLFLVGVAVDIQHVMGE